MRAHAALQDLKELATACTVSDGSLRQLDLDLSENNLTDDGRDLEGMKALAKAVSEAKQGSGKLHLDLSNCRIDEESKLKLQERESSDFMLDVDLSPR